MGVIHPDRVSASEWREWNPTAGDMLRMGWEVIGICRQCELIVTVRLARMPAPTVLWERTLRCPRWRCDGRLNIHGQPYQLRSRRSMAWVDVTGTKLDALLPRQG